MRGMNAYSRVNVFAGLARDGWAEVEANLIYHNELVLTEASEAHRREADGHSPLPARVDRESHRDFHRR